MKILETIVTTTNTDGSTHITPLGVRLAPQGWLLSPFLPSRTNENLRREKCAVINRIDDVRIFSGCLTGHLDWPLVAADVLPVKRLACALTHTEVRVEKISENGAKSTFVCQPVYEKIHRAFQGFNRAQSAIIELAILVSRLHLLPIEKIQQGVNFLRPMMEKTGGEHEQIAWRWLMDTIDTHKKRTQES